MTFSDLEWLSKIFNDTKRSAVSLRQLSFLFYTILALATTFTLRYLTFLSDVRRCQCNLLLPATDVGASSIVMPLTVGKGAICVAFVRPSVCLSVAYIANNSRTQRSSAPKFGRKVPHLRCDSQTSLKVKRSKVRVRGGRGHTVSAKSGGHTACFDWVCLSESCYFSNLTRLSCNYHRHMLHAYMIHLYAMQAFIGVVAKIAK